jgi:hypothetical protein
METLSIERNQLNKVFFQVKVSLRLKEDTGVSKSPGSQHNCDPDIDLEAYGKV